MVDLFRDLLDAFIPGEGNGYTPRFFRIRSITILGLVIVLLSAGAIGLNTFVLSNHNFTAAIISAALVDLTNDDRETLGLQALSVDQVLERAAALKAADMAEKGYFAHTSPEGKSPWYWFREAGYEFSYAGENLAVRFSDSVEVERAWMNSPSHRANISSEKFSNIGIATAEGIYEGQPAVFVVQMFGRPAERATVHLTPVAYAFEKPLENVDADVAGARSPENGVALLDVVPEDVRAEVIVEDDTFIAVRRDSREQPTTVDVPVSDFTSFFQKILTSPRTLLNTIYVVLGAVIAVALALFVGIEPRRQYPLHVFLGVLLILLMASLLFAWQVLTPGTKIL